MSQRGYYVNSMSPLRADFRRDPQRVLAVLKAYSDELEAFAASLPPIREDDDGYEPEGTPLARGAA